MEFNIGLLLVGMLFFFVGALLLGKYLKNRKNNTMPGKGRVVNYFTEIHHDSDIRNSVIYYPIIRYYALGKYFEGKSGAGRERQIYGIGEEVEILYNPDRPENFTIAGDNSGLFASIMSLAIGIGILILAFFEK